MRSNQTATVIGAGIQGCTIALQLEKRGFTVNLVDQADDIFARASLAQEGKVHLGLLYVLDESGRTPRKILEDALHFAPVLESLVSRKIDWPRLQSSPFHYVVSRDSLLSIDELLPRYAALEEHYEELLRDPEVHYLGRRPHALFTPQALDPLFDGELFDGCVRTAECAVSPERLREILRDELEAKERIRLLLRHRVVDLRDGDCSYKVRCLTDTGPTTVESDLVVNAAWEGRRKLDACLGLADGEVWTTRLKFGLWLEKPAAQRVPTFLVVQGGFGEYVDFPRESYAYLSWYPDCMVAETTENEIPAHWEGLRQGRLDRSDVRRVCERSLQALRRIVPGIGDTPVLAARAGAIVARGQGRISDRASDLHQRLDSVVVRKGAYYSINTSKFTSAPNNSRKLMELI